MIDHHGRCFLFGMAGNAAVEVVRILNSAQRGQYHRKYRDWRFWVARIILTLLSGVMALAYSYSGLSLPLLAFHVGAGATLLIEKMTQTPPDIPSMPRDHSD